MQAHLETEAGDANEPVDNAGEPKDPFEDFADALGLDEDGEEPEEDEEDTGEEAEEEQSEDEADEPEEELPAIEPPNSLTAEEKEAFKNLPREAQEFTARRIGELEKGFQAKAQEAAHTRQTVENEARQALAQLQQQAAAELQQYAALIEPQRPDPMQYGGDWQAYQLAQAHYEALVAQRGQAQQRAQEYAAQAQAQQVAVEQAEMAREVEILKSAFPEWYAPETSANLQSELTAIAKELGYSDEHVQHARATDILAMRKAAEWKAKADKLDSLNKTKMEKVREAKALPKVTKPGIARGAPSKQTRAEASWQAARSAKNKDVQASAFADFLEASGHL